MVRCLVRYIHPLQASWRQDPPCLAAGKSQMQDGYDTMWLVGKGAAVKFV